MSDQLSLSSNGLGLAKATTNSESVRGPISPFLASVIGVGSGFVALLGLAALITGVRGVECVALTTAVIGTFCLSGQGIKALATHLMNHLVGGALVVGGYLGRFALLVFVMFEIQQTGFLSDKVIGAWFAITVVVITAGWLAGALWGYAHEHELRYDSGYQPRPDWANQV